MLLRLVLKELNSLIRDNENVLPYVHLPVQSGSNKILKLMGRKYTRESYLELVHKLRENIPNLCLTTDIIVGFPNETDEDFNDTLSIVNECKYDQAYTFIYSKRQRWKIVFRFLKKKKDYKYLMS